MHMPRASTPSICRALMQSHMPGRTGRTNELTEMLLAASDQHQVGDADARITAIRLVVAR